MTPRAWRDVALPWLLGAVLACWGGAASAPSAASSAGSYAPAHFVFQYTALDAGNITTIASAGEGQYASWMTSPPSACRRSG